jgi:curved DNA-binding protein CbpA
MTMLKTTDVRNVFWMSSHHNTDYYEILQVSATAHVDTIDRIFRHLAQRYHPDNRETGNRERFQLVIEAHDVLKDDEKRAQYDLARKEFQGQHAGLLRQVIGDDRVESDEKIQAKLLALLYVKCRENIADPGMGLYELVQLLNCPKESLEFNIWYMKDKGWIRRTEDGMLAITVQGVDRANEDRKNQSSIARITNQSDHSIKL